MFCVGGVGVGVGVGMHLSVELGLGWRSEVGGYAGSRELRLVPIWCLVWAWAAPKPWGQFPGRPYPTVGHALLTRTRHTVPPFLYPIRGRVVRVGVRVGVEGLQGV